MNEDQKAVMRGTVSAKLMSETTPFVVNTIPSLPASATDSMIASRDVTLANHAESNAQKTTYRAARCAPPGDQGGPPG